MAEREITLPSGAEIVVRGMKLSEANKLAARVDASGGQAGTNASGGAAAPHVFNDLLRMCTVSIANPGPYESTDLAGFWDSALVADRFHSLIQIRCVTYPKLPYTFRYQCESRDSGGCGEAFSVSLNLERGGDLRYADLPEESRKLFKAGNRFEAMIAGRKVVFSLSTGRDEARTAEYLKRYPQWPISAGLASRIVQIEGIEDLDKLRWLNDLDLGDFMELRDAMEAVDGGIDTNMDLPCPHCGHINFDVSIPFGRQFLLPASSRR